MRQLNGIMFGWIASALVAIALGNERPAYCWDKFGHEVIAQIAWDHMTPEAQASAAALIQAFNADPLVEKEPAKYQPYNFVTAAAFMDDIAARGAHPEPGATAEYNSWHFINLPDDPGLTIGQIESFRDQHPSNVYLAIRNACLPPLQSSFYPAMMRGRALAMFVHFAGDIHQPLDATARGLGGNRYAIDPLPSADATDPMDTLHEFWDGAYRYVASGGVISLAEPAGDLPRVDAPGTGESAAFARKLEAKYRQDELADALELDPAEWALESNRVANTFVFNDLHNATALTPGYVIQAAEITQRRMVLAGLRIANVLSTALAPHPRPKWGGG